MSEGSSIIDLGFYGKLPAYGDFIQKRLPQDFVNPWHEWLQKGMMAVRESDPDGWLTYYLNCPAWSFALSAGVCGEQAVAGVTIPSVDKVGRYFNFTMASILPPGTEPTSLAFARHSWFDTLENLALSALDEENDQDQIEQAINDLSAELSWDSASPPFFEDTAVHTRVVDQSADTVTALLPALLHQFISRLHQPYGLWWHHGSSQVSAQLLTCRGMPGTETYLCLMKDEDLVVPEQAGEPDYLDELLSS